MNKELLKHARNYIDKMANGINPINNNHIPEDDLLNDVRIVRCLFYVSGILKEVIDNDRITKKVLATKKFYISPEKIKLYKYTGDLSISKIAVKINSMIDDIEMKGVKGTDIVKWLVHINLLTEIVTSDNKKRKAPTEEGKTIGIYLEHRVGMRGEYDIVMYNNEAQKFIINHFDNFLVFLDNLN